MPTEDLLRVLPHCVCGRPVAMQRYGDRVNLTCDNESCKARPSVWMHGEGAAIEAWIQIVQIASKHQEVGK